MEEPTFVQSLPLLYADRHLDAGRILGGKWAMGTLFGRTFNKKGIKRLKKVFPPALGCA